MKHIGLAIGVAATVAASLIGVANAGYKWTFGTVAVKNTDGSGYGYAAQGTARANANTSERVYCSFYTGSVTCGITNASNVSVACSTSDAAMMTVLRSFGTDSYLYISFDSTGKCTYVNVFTDSGLQPKVT